ncbi:MAG: hypothetical protein NWF06_00570 [Candidatus Bathyarchaeota archaeon]|nr:hypothetical protein [Candidatus Bathyarchaeum sp.]
MSTIDKILFLLKDGKWHDLNEITQKVTSSKTKSEMAVNFLKEYDFIKQNQDTKVKLQPTILNFITTLQRLETEEQTN